MTFFPDVIMIIWQCPWTFPPGFLGLILDFQVLGKCRSKDTSPLILARVTQDVAEVSMVSCANDVHCPLSFDYWQNNSLMHKSFKFLSKIYLALKTGNGRAAEWPPGQESKTGGAEATIWYFTWSQVSLSFRCPQMWTHCTPSWRLSVMRTQRLWQQGWRSAGRNSLAPSTMSSPSSTASSWPR